MATVHLQSVVSLDGALTLRDFPPLAGRTAEKARQMARMQE